MLKLGFLIAALLSAHASFAQNETPQQPPPPAPTTQPTPPVKADPPQPPQPQPPATKTALLPEAGSLRIYLDLGPKDAHAPKSDPYKGKADTIKRAELEGGIRKALGYWQSVLPELDFALVPRLQEANLAVRFRNYYTPNYVGGGAAANALSMQPGHWKAKADLSCGSSHLCSDHAGTSGPCGGASPLGPYDRDPVQALNAAGKVCDERHNNTIIFRPYASLVDGAERLGGAEREAYFQDIFSLARPHFREPGYAPSGPGDYAQCVDGKTNPEKTKWDDRCVRNWDSVANAAKHAVAGDLVASLQHELGHLLIGSTVHTADPPGYTPWQDVNRKPVILERSPFAYKLPYSVMDGGYGASLVGRGVFPRDVEQLRASGYRVNYPIITGLIQLTNKAGKVFLTSDWTAAHAKMIWPGNGGRTAPDTLEYFLSDVFPRAGARRVLAAGEGHVLALKANGTLWTWGKNDKGQLGDGNTLGRAAPAQVGDDTDWVSVAAAADFSFALKADGSLWSWGDNGQGQQGDGSAIDRRSPRRIGGDEDWILVKAESRRVAALKSDGAVWAWGFENGRIPAMKRDGNWAAWVVSKDAPPATADGAKDPKTPRGDWDLVAAGGRFTVALKKDGTLWGWGANDRGQLGQGRSTPFAPAPVKIPWTPR